MLPAPRCGICSRSLRCYGQPLRSARQVLGPTMPSTTRPGGTTEPEGIGLECPDGVVGVRAEVPVDGSGGVAPEDEQALGLPDPVAHVAAPGCRVAVVVAAEHRGGAHGGAIAAWVIVAEAGAASAAAPNAAIRVKVSRASMRLAAMGTDGRAMVPPPWSCAWTCSLRADGASDQVRNCSDTCLPHRPDVIVLWCLIRRSSEWTVGVG